MYLPKRDELIGNKLRQILHRARFWHACGADDNY